MGVGALQCAWCSGRVAVDLLQCVAGGRFAERRGALQSGLEVTRLAGGRGVFEGVEGHGMVQAVEAVVPPWIDRRLSTAEDAVPQHQPLSARACVCERESVRERVRERVCVCARAYVWVKDTVAKHEPCQCVCVLGGHLLIRALHTLFLAAGGC